MIYLRDINQKYNNKWVFLSVIFGVLGIAVAIVNQNFFVSVGLFLLCTAFGLKANKLQNDFNADFEDEIKMSDNFSGVLRDKEGKIKKLEILN